MGINIQAKTDYTSLFSSINTNNNGVSDLTGLLSEYSSIKSGTYGKLLKSYYSTDAGKASAASMKEKSKNPSVDETKATYNKVSTSADALQKSVDEIKGLKSDASKDDIYNAVNNYVKSYNSFIDAGVKSGNANISSKVDTIANNSTVNEKSLNAIGITIGEKGQLSLDREKLDSADLSSVQDLFAKRASYGYSTSVTAGMAASNANYEATKTSLYTNNGGYNISTGTMMDSLF